MDRMKKNARHGYNAEKPDEVRREWLGIICKKDRKKTGDAEK